MYSGSDEERRRKRREYYAEMKYNPRFHELRRAAQQRYRDRQKQAREPDSEES